MSNKRVTVFDIAGGQPDMSGFKPASTTRWIIETDCDQCGEPYDGHKGPTVDGRCSGGSRIVVDPDNLPPERVERGSDALEVWLRYVGIPEELMPSANARAEIARSVVGAFLSDPEPGDQ